VRRWEFGGINATTSVEYAFIDIAGRPYVLPVRAESAMWRSPDSSYSRRASSDSSQQLVDFRNVVSFIGYRKFSADSSIDFSAADNKKKLIPEFR
jgi:hypothetical protein